MFTGISISNKKRTIGTTYRTKPAGGMLFLFLQYHERTTRSWRFFRTCRNRPIKSHSTIHIQATTLVLQTDINGTLRCGLAEQLTITINNQRVQIKTMAHEVLIRSILK